MGQNELVDVFVFRHGETDWNVERRFQGHTDIPLNENGRAQAVNLAPALQNLKLEVILSSDLKRAIETAEIANSKLKLEIIRSSHLREALLGDPEGQLRDDILKIYGEENWRRWISVDPDHLDFSFPNGESKRQQLNRSLGFIEDFLSKVPSARSIAVSTHGGTLRRLVHHCTGAPTEPIPIPNCSLYHLQKNITAKTWTYLGRKDSLKIDEKLFR